MSNVVIDGVLPVSYAKLDQLGMKIALGLEGYPSNRMIMTYGPPGGGKSTLLYQLAGQYEKNGDEVWIVDAERAIDRIYFASYLPKEDTVEFKLEALKYYLKVSESLLKKESKAKEGERTTSDEQLGIIQRRVEMIPKVIKALKEDKEVELVPEDPLANRRISAALLRNGIAEYRLRNIRIVQYDTLEEFERETVKLVEARKEDPNRRHKRLLIGVDSINYLLPEEVLERGASSEGSNFVTAKYLHTLLPKLITKLAGTETSMFIIHQKTTTIKMNPWEIKSPIDDVATKGGSAAKFGATTMIGVERRKKAKSVDDKDVDTGIIDIPKAKLRGGSKGTFRGKFFLKESIESSKMDFNEPFIMDVLVEEQYGVRKHRGKYYVPERLLQGHPDYEEIVKPALVPFPKEEDEAEVGKLYFTGSEKQLVDALEASPSFEEECLQDHGILANV